jgi:phosphatidate cytidylyltransferase
MLARVVTATVLIILALFAIYLGGWWFTLALAALVVFGQLEFFGMVRVKGTRPAEKLCLAAALLLLAVAQAIPELSTAAFVLSGAAVCFSLLFRTEPASIADMATSLLGLFYTGFLPTFLIRLRALDGGVFFLLLTFGCIWASDIGAFFFGRAFGRTHPWPRISPKKTIEGAIFGTGASVIVGLLGAALLHWPLWPLTGAAFGMVVGLTSLLGDLTESLMKRDVGLKDSGNLLPGHGGIMDRADSYIFTAPIAFYFVSVFVLERLPLP